MTVSYKQYPDVERLNNYCPGGYHPVHLGDTFKNQRYTVVHKLGYGSYSTVWLVHDSLTNKYASLKVLDANASTRHSDVLNNSGEVRVLRHLQSYRGDDEGINYVLQLLDSFEHTGPNGVHHCIVTEVLGLPLCTDIEDVYPDEVFPPEVARRFAWQIGLAVRFLHSMGVAHGDLHLGNVLLISPRIASWSTQQDVENYLGKPCRQPFRLRDTDTLAPASPHAPAYCVHVPDPGPLLHLCLADRTYPPHIKLCDFSEAFIYNASRPSAHASKIPMVFRAPEVLLPQSTDMFPMPKTDVWALAVLFHMIFTGGCGLFLSPYEDEDDVLCGMVLFLGTLPDPLWSRWENRTKFFDNKGNWVGDKENMLRMPRKFLKHREGGMDQDEMRCFEDMLRKMVDYEPERRISAEQVVASEWFVRYCRRAGATSS